MQPQKKKKPNTESSTEAGFTTKHNRFQPHPLAIFFARNPQQSFQSRKNFMPQVSTKWSSHSSSEDSKRNAEKRPPTTRFTSSKTSKYTKAPKAQLPQFQHPDYFSTNPSKSATIPPDLTLQHPKISPHNEPLKRPRSQHTNSKPL